MHFHLLISWRAGKQRARASGRGSFFAFLLTRRKWKKDKVSELEREGESKKSARSAATTSTSTTSTATSTLKLASPKEVEISVQAGRERGRGEAARERGSCSNLASSDLKPVLQCTQRFVRCHWKLNKLKLDDVSTKAKSGESPAMKACQGEGKAVKKQRERRG